MFFIHDKTKVAASFKKFTKRAQNEFDVKIKKIRSDKRKEFNNKTLKPIVMKLGSSMRSPQLTLLNKMVWLRERTGH